MLLGFVSSYSFEGNDDKIPKIVRRTLKMKLNENDFYDKKTLFLNVDTLSTKNSIWDFDYYIFETKKDFISQFSYLNNFLQSKKINKFYTLNNNPLYDSNKHWVLRVEENEKIYEIDWWFSDYDENKLKGISISLIKNGN
jgi:hypothetical protein